MCVGVGAEVYRKSIFYTTSGVERPSTPLLQESETLIPPPQMSSKCKAHEKTRQRWRLPYDESWPKDSPGICQHGAGPPGSHL